MESNKKEEKMNEILEEDGVNVKELLKGSQQKDLKNLLKEKTGISILGTHWEIIEGETLRENEGCDGQTKIYDKKILIMPESSMLEKDATVFAKSKRWKEVMRHEIFHAFFCECGLDDYCRDEKLVDFLAAQFPKLLDLFYDMEVL